MYQIIWSNAARRQFRRISNPHRTRIHEAVSQLAETPLPHGYTTITGRQDTYRIRIGTYRVIYEVNNNEVIIRILAVGSRGQVYNQIH